MTTQLVTFDTNLGLVPLINFGVVNAKKQVYRSGQPLHRKDYKWLHDVLGIENIIDLRAESNEDEERAPEFGIKAWKVPVIDGDVPSIDLADDFVSIMNQMITNHKPVLIHCEHGHGRTSTFCVLAQLMMGMSLEDALAEETNKYHYNFHHPVQVEFIYSYYKLRFEKT